jgi:hypothetical protein
MSNLDFSDFWVQVEQDRIVAKQAVPIEVIKARVNKGGLSIDLETLHIWLDKLTPDTSEYWMLIDIWAISLFNNH